MKPAILKKLSIGSIQLDIENPRIKQFIEMYGDNVSAEGIALALAQGANDESSTTYNALLDSIKTSKGIIHPIVVNKDRNGVFTVIEGNTRLQIYKDFAQQNPTGPWNEIMALIYDDLSEIEKHQIRLQSHLVGPRDWDPYSKAKYLYHLSVEEGLPMPTIISLCGGKERDIKTFIRAYEYLQSEYVPYSKKEGKEIDIRDFSKFTEYFKNASLIRSVERKYPSDQFAKWVVDGNVDKAQLVRKIPVILQDEEATVAFEKKNLSEAEIILNSHQLEKDDLSQYPYEVICRAAWNKLTNLPAEEIQNLANSDDDSYDQKRFTLGSLKDWISIIFSQIESARK